MPLLTALAPELLLVVVACGLFLLGTSGRAGARHLAAVVALVTLVGVFVWQGLVFLTAPGAPAAPDAFDAVRTGGLTAFVNAAAALVGSIFVLLAWPTNAAATGSASHDFGTDAGEFFALALLSLAGVCLVAAANDLILLFLAIELAAIPTYIMVSVSRPLPVAQEAGVKYFFLGAMAAAVMLFGFSYLYGATGHVRLDKIAAAVDATRDPASGGWAAPNAAPWLVLGAVVLLAGFAFKIAAVPFHAYAGDVYQGAATPVTALIAFVPKTSGFLAILKILAAVGGAHYAVPPVLVKVLWVVALLTMTFGNTLGLLQLNVKRVLAYSSIAHSGYLLVAVTALVSAGPNLGAGHRDAATAVQQSAVLGILFYLATYGLMNAGALGVLMLLPGRGNRLTGEPGGQPATTAETYEDLAGTGKTNPGLGIAMAVCCLSLTGLPLTVGFLGKAYLVKPALGAGLIGLSALLMLNAAISAGYYLKIVATMFVRPAPVPFLPAGVGGAGDDGVAAALRASLARSCCGPVGVAVGLCVAATVAFGVVFPLTGALTGRLGAASAAMVSPPAMGPGPVAAPATMAAATAAATASGSTPQASAR